ncbi:MAG: SDR family oxidoreductase, partial [Planctomycetes bacterium]|nr:SDR family oxidoreductase [Planctomycetota bacterium]
AVQSFFARDARRIEEVAAEIRARGGRAQAFGCDVRERRAVDRAFDAAREAQGPFFALVANSGIGGANEPGPADRFDDLVATNLVGTYSTLRAAERHLAPGPEPRHLVVNASILARIGVAGYTGYCASKAGLLGLVRALAVELAPQNVQVNAVCPGWVETDMALQGLEGLARAMHVPLEEARRRALALVPLGRMSQPDEIAGVVAWLLSPDARGATGQGIDVNGGGFML